MRIASTNGASGSGLLNVSGPPAKMNGCRVARECVRLAREILGANGVSDEYQTGRHFCNIEGVHTYEGTDDIHSLIIGQALTPDGLCDLGNNQVRAAVMHAAAVSGSPRLGDVVRALLAEAEMQKVTWPGWGEVTQGTMAVTGMVIGRSNLPLAHEGDALFHIAITEGDGTAEHAVAQFKARHDADTPA